MVFVKGLGGTYRTLEILDQVFVSVSICCCIYLLLLAGIDQKPKSGRVYERFFHYFQSLEIMSDHVEDHAAHSRMATEIIQINWRYYVSIYRSVLSLFAKFS